MFRPLERGGELSTKPDNLYLANGVDISAKGC